MRPRTARTLERVAGGLGLVEVEQAAGGLEAAPDGTATEGAAAAAIGAVETAIEQLLADLEAAGVIPVQHSCRPRSSG